MFGRRTRTLLPTADKLLETTTSRAASTALADAKARQATYYDRGAKERPPLPVGQTVRVKYNEHPEWRKAEIAEVLPHRSYLVRFEDGTTRRRTSKHVRFSAEPPIIVENDDTDVHVDKPPCAPPIADTRSPSTARVTKPRQTRAQQPPTRNNAIKEPNAPLTVTRSGRIVRRPARYKD
jgi:hypothetical protein